MRLLRRLLGDNDNGDATPKKIDRGLRTPRETELENHSAYNSEFREAVYEASNLFYEDEIVSVAIDDESHEFNLDGSDIRDSGLLDFMEENYEEGVHYTQIDDDGETLTIELYRPKAEYEVFFKGRNHTGTKSNEKERIISEPNDWNILNSGRLGGTTPEVKRRFSPESTIEITYDEQDPNN